jgi:ribosomal protection tetracycline resistance protein
MRTLNLGILAHVDAGKTTLTERLLYAVGVIDEIGRVDDGSTQTDSLALEQKRGITIKSAVVSFVIDDVAVNLIDTPGHPDFIAEVERVLGVLDGVILVISSVDGVQAQTRVLMRSLQRLRLPTLLFLNKIDRAGAQDEALVRSISEKLTPAVIPMGKAHELGTRSAYFTPQDAADHVFRTRLMDALGAYNDELITAHLEGPGVSDRRLHDELVVQTKRALVHPAFFGSAVTGAGIDSLIANVPKLLPTAEGDPGGSLSGTVFKVERGPVGEKIAYARMFSGTLQTRDRVRVGEKDQKVTAISVFHHGSAARRQSISAGQIGKLWGLGDIQIGDPIGTPYATLNSHVFAPPTLETVVVPRRSSDKGALHIALTQLAEQDPLINLRQDDLRQELFVSLYGEVQKEVIEETLTTDFHIDVDFRETTIICIERPSGTGSSAEVMGKGVNPFAATVGLRIEPAEFNSGLAYRLEVELGSLPRSFQTAVEETVHETLHQGINGWQVTDCTVTLTHSGYSSAGSAAGDFRNLTPLVLMRALQLAGTDVYEPIHHFRLEIPTDTLGPVLGLLGRLDAVPQEPQVVRSSCTLEGEIPAARVHGLQEQLATLTRGEGILEYAFASYRLAHGAIPSRPRTDHNPLNRKEYLLHLSRAGY